MATRKPAETADTTEPKATADDVEIARAEIQAVHDEASDKGYFGHTPDPFPNEAYSLATGPKSPSAAEALAAVKSPKEA